MRMGTWIEARPKLHIPGLIDSKTDECHITLAYLGKADPAAVMEKMQDGGQLYRGGYWPSLPVLSEINGLARWINADGYHVDVALVAPVLPKVDGVENIYDLQERVHSRLHRTFPVDDTYPFTPHITLPGGWPVEPNKQRPILWSRVMFAITELYVSYTSEDGAVNTLITQPE